MEKQAPDGGLLLAVWIKISFATSRGKLLACLRTEIHCKLITARASIRVHVHQRRGGKGDPAQSKKVIN
jgi:hypothetical protein